jgi:hypothetical protein
MSDMNDYNNRKLSREELTDEMGNKNKKSNRDKVPCDASLPEIYDHCLLFKGHEGEHLVTLKKTKI